MFNESIWFSTFATIMAIAEIFMAWRALVWCSNADAFGRNIGRHIMLRSVAFVYACKAAGWVLLNFHSALFLKFILTFIIITIWFGYFDRLFHKISYFINGIFHLSVNREDKGAK